MLPPVQLLADIRRVFAECRTDRLSSELLAKEVKRSQTTLAHQLKPFGIRPQVMRLGDRTPRGYRLSDFEDAFELGRLVNARNFHSLAEDTR